MDEKHVSKVVKNDEEQPRNGLPLRRVEPRNVWTYKRLWVLVILFALGSVGVGVVPAAKVPLFARLVQAMGFAPSEMGEMSLLQALLKWHQKYQAGIPRKLTDEEIAANARESARLGLAYAEREMEQRKKNGESALISMSQVNAAQRRNGQAVDRVRGAIRRAPGDETDDIVAWIANDKAVAKTEANAGANGELWFGQETGALARDAKDGFNSINMLSRVGNTNIAGSTSASWFSTTLERAQMSDADLGRISREVDTLSHSVDLGDIKNIGKDRPHRDLSYAWLMGKTTYRTSNVLLKKTLAVAGFQGADMPKKVFDSSLTGRGVGIDPTEVTLDADAQRNRLAKRENCKNKLLFGSASKKENYVKIRESVKQLRGQFPSTCKEAAAPGALDNFRSVLTAVNKQCQKINATYADLQKNCNVAFVRGECSNLSGAYDGRLASFKKECENLYKKCLGETDANGVPNTPKYCAEKRDNTLGGELEGACKGGSCDSMRVYHDARQAITGYASGEDDDFSQNDNVKTKDNGDNENGYLASQNVQDIIDTLRGLNKQKKNTP